jgi:hypothetical protein
MRSPQGDRRLHIERTIEKGGYEDAESSTEVMADKRIRMSGQVSERLSPEQQPNKRSRRILPTRRCTCIGGNAHQERDVR